MSDEVAGQIMAVLAMLLVVPVGFLVTAMVLASRAKNNKPTEVMATPVRAETPFSILGRFVYLTHFVFPIILAIPFLFWLMWQVLKDWEVIQHFFPNSTAC